MKEIEIGKWVEDNETLQFWFSQNHQLVVFRDRGPDGPDEDWSWVLIEVESVEAGDVSGVVILNGSAPEKEDAAVVSLTGSMAFMDRNDIAYIKPDSVYPTFH